MKKKKVIIIGAGPAGLTLAYELLTRSKMYDVTILEEDSIVGGISKTVYYKGNRMDMGGHRFFSKIDRVNNWWDNILPIQGVVPIDDKILNRKSSIKDNGPDPDKTDIVMLKRNRVSRIYYNNSFFDYPISLKWDTIKNMGVGTTIEVGFSYIKSCIFKRKENSLEDFYINRFGKKLYEMFFEKYTENLWGRHPKYISPDWGEQRVKGLSILTVLKNIFIKDNKNKETSLIEEFSYPKLGPGELWEIVANKININNGNIIMNAKVISINKDNNIIRSVKYIKDNKEYELKGDYIVSSMPLKDLVINMNDVAKKYYDIASNLPYRDFITIGVLLDNLKLVNNTKIKTINNIVPDNWIYVHDKNVNMGRLQIFNNWSPYLVKENNKNIWIGLEYFCSEKDSFWNKDDDTIANIGINELIKMKLIDKSNVIDYHVERIRKAYPAYFDSYKDIDKLINYLNKIDNLFCIGRNGQHRYNNMDHSMCTAFLTADLLISGKGNKKDIWSVNTEKEYHEKIK